MRKTISRYKYIQVHESLQLCVHSQTTVFTAASHKPTPHFLLALSAAYEISGINACRQESKSDKVAASKLQYKVLWLFLLSISKQ